MYGMITLALFIMIADSMKGFLIRRRDNHLHGYREPQVGSFPPRRCFIDHRIEGVLKAHRFRKIRKYQQRIDKITRKIQALDSK